MFLQLPDSIDPFYFFIGFCIALLAAAWLINRNSVHPIAKPTPTPWDVRGWLWVIAVMLTVHFISGAAMFVSLIQEHFIAPERKVNNALTLVTTALALTGSGFSLFLLFSRRDIFRYVFTGYMSYFLLVIGYEAYRMYFEVFVLNDLFPKAAILLYIIPLAIIGSFILYILRSERSRNTFVLPHKRLVTYDEEIHLEDLEAGA